MSSGDTIAAGVSPSETISTNYRRYALTLLFLVYTLNFVDRQIVNILAELIKRDLHLTDWQLGSLTGLSFALFYATLALPIARLAERSNRAKIVAISAIVWSAFTALCGAAHSFAQLFLARVGVGVGEAGCTPASQSLISDYVPREKRASAMALFSLGIPAGSLVGMALGGLVADSLGWRMSFALVGIPGVLLGILTYFTLPEPRKLAAVATVDTKTTNLKQALHTLRTKKTYVWLTTAMAFMSFGTYGQLAFQSSYFLRNHTGGLDRLASQLDGAIGVQLGTTGFLGVVLGLVIGVFGAVGTWMGGWLSDRAGKTNVKAYVTIPAISAFLLPLSIFATYVSSNTVLVLTLIGMPMLLQSIYYGPLFGTVQSLVDPRTRATASAILLFFANLVGLGLGPLVIGVVSDILTPSLGSGDAIRWSLIIMSGVYFLAMGAFLMARRTIEHDIVS